MIHKAWPCGREVSVYASAHGGVKEPWVERTQMTVGVHLVRDGPPL